MKILLVGILLILAGCRSEGIQASYEQNIIDNYKAMGYANVVVNNYYVYYTIPQENVRCREHINNYYADNCWKLGDGQ